MMKIKALTLDQGNHLKGLGILLIVLHNFFHNVPPVIGENEFSFNPGFLKNFTDALAGPASEWVRVGFSFLGHYGVGIFIFLSAYGLARRYPSGRTPYFAFLRSRFSKVYVTFLTCVALYLALWLVRAYVLGVSEPVPWRSLALKLTLISNFVPREALSPVGPWWFLPFIFQLYALFPALAWLSDRWGANALVVVAAIFVVVEWAINPALMAIGLNLNHMVFGHMTVICLGVFAARLTDVSVTPAFVVVAAAGFVVGNFYPTWWLLSDLWATILLVVGSVWAAQSLALPAGVLWALAYFGRVSLPLFLVNGFLRGPFHELALSWNRWWVTIMCAGLSLLFSTFMALVLQTVDSRVRSVWRTSGTHR